MRTAVCALLMTGFLLNGCGSRQDAPQTMKEDLGGDFITKAESFLAKKDYDQAVQIFKDVLAKDPNNAKAHFALAQTYMRMEEYKSAFEHFQAVTNLEPGNSEAYLLLGGCYDMLGDRAKAIDNVKKSVEIAQERRDEPSFKRSVAILHQLMQ